MENVGNGFYVISIMSLLRKKLSNINLLLLNIGKAEHYSDWNWKSVCSPFARIYLVKDGGAKVMFAGSERNLLPGNLYFIPAFMTHSCVCESYFSLYYIHLYEAGAFRSLTEQFDFPEEIEAMAIDFQLLERLMFLNPRRALTKYDPEQYDNQESLLRSIGISEETELATQLETKGILTQLFSRFLTGATPKATTSDERVLRILDYVAANIANNFTLSELAELAFLSPDHLIRLFKKEMSCTPIQYINTKKIETAQLQLLITDSSVKEVAYNLNFESVSYFTKLFRSFTGVTPQEYRKNIRASVGPVREEVNAEAIR
jgi:AraC-like DNA-binding protein